MFLLFAEVAGEIVREIEDDEAEEHEIETELDIRWRLEGVCETEEAARTQAKGLIDANRQFTNRFAICEPEDVNDDGLPDGFKPPVILKGNRDGDTVALRKV